MTEIKNIPKKEDLMVIPKDETLEATIVDLEVKTWLDITQDQTKRTNLRDPEGTVLVVKYDAAGLIRQDIFPFSKNPTTTSRYGRFIEKYGDFKISQTIKVQFNEDGNSDIIISPKKK